MSPEPLAQVIERYSQELKRAREYSNHLERRIEALERRPVLGDEDTALSALVSWPLSWPEIRGLWAGSYDGQSTLVGDLTGLAHRFLTVNSPAAGSDGRIGFIGFASSSSERLRIGDAAWNSETAGNGLSVFGWFRIDSGSLGNSTGLISKYDTGQKSFLLWKGGSDTINFRVSSDGSTNSAEASSPAVGAGYIFVFGRYKPSTELALFVNGSWYLDTTSIPASLHNSTADLEIGAYSNGGIGTFLDGRMVVAGYIGNGNDMSNAMVEAYYENTRALFGV